VVALLSPSRPKQRTPLPSIKLRVDKTPHLFQFSNRLSSLLSRLITMIVRFFQVYGLQPILSQSSELRMVRPVPPSIVPVNSGTRAIPRILPVGFACLIFAAPFLFTVQYPSSRFDKPRTGPYPSFCKRKKIASAMLGHDIGFCRGGLILPWQEGKSRVHISICARLSIVATTATL